MYIYKCRIKKKIKKPLIYGNLSYAMFQVAKQNKGENEFKRREGSPSDIGKRQGEGEETGGVQDLRGVRHPRGSGVRGVSALDLEKVFDSGGDLAHQTGGSEEERPLLARKRPIGEH